MEKIKFINNTNSINKYNKDKHIYLGSETCERKLFCLNDLKKIVLKNKKQKITLVFPYLTPQYFDKVKEMFSFINLHTDIFCEIVFNDWGLFYFIRKNYPDMKLCLGRLLHKQKTDPYFHDIINNKKQISYSKDNIFIPKKITKETKYYFSQFFANSKIFQKFMLENNIIRIEIDNVNWKINLKLPKTIKASIYFPYVHITTTRFCTYLNMLKNKDCKRHCEKFNVELTKYRIPYNYIIRGNAVNYKNTILPTRKELIKNNIDRIIINE